MLDLGFLPDVERIVRLTPDSRQTMLFSATMPGDVVTLARRHMRRPTNIRAEGHGGPAPAPSTAQHGVPGAPDGQDRSAGPGPAGQGPRLDHGVLPDQAGRRSGRQRAGNQRLRGGDRARRPGPGPAGAGAPRVPQRQGRRAYRHRGRGPQAGRGRRHPRGELRMPGRRKDLRAPHRPDRASRRPGVAITFVDWRDMHRWKLINDALGLGKPEPEETYSTSEHLFTQLDIPRGATGTLPRAMRGRAGLEAEAVEDIGETGKIRSPRPGRGRGSAGQGGSGRGGSGQSGSGQSGSGQSGSGRSRNGGSSGGPSGGQSRGGSGQARKTSAAGREAGDGTGGAARSTRRRRTRAGRELGSAENRPAESGPQETQPQESRRKAS